MTLRIVAVLMLIGTAALAHDGYDNWVSRTGVQCCNRMDCRPIPDADFQLSPVTKVRVEGEWCPVLEKHYLQRGRTPDGTTAHVCVRPAMGPYSPSPCERLLCFQPPALH